MAFKADFASTITIADTAAVTMMGWATNNASITATARKNVAAVAGLAVVGKPSFITISTGATFALLGWAARGATLHANANEAASVAGITGHSSSTISTVTITGGANVTMIGWVEDYASINADVNGWVRAAVGVALYGHKDAILIIDGGSEVTMKGWAADGATIEATAAVGFALRALTNTVISISGGANVTMLGWAARNGAIQAVGGPGPAALGMALSTNLDSTANITIVGGANVTMGGWALHGGTIEAAAPSYHAAAAVGMALYATAPSVTIAGGASAIVLGRATDTGTIRASVKTFAAAAVGVALFGVHTVSTGTSTLVVTDAANVTIFGWVARNATIQATASSHVAAAVGIAVAFSTSTVTVSGGATISTLGWATHNASISAIATSSVAAAVGMAVCGYGSHESRIVITDGAIVTMKGWAAHGALILVTSTSYIAALGLVATTRVSVDGTGTSVTLGLCHDSTTDIQAVGTSNTAALTLIASTILPSSTLVKVTNHSDIFTPTSACAVDSQHFEAGMDEHGLWTAEGDRFNGSASSSWREEEADDLEEGRQTAAMNMISSWWGCGIVSPPAPSPPTSTPTRSPSPSLSKASISATQTNSRTARRSASRALGSSTSSITSAAPPPESTSTMPHEAATGESHTFSSSAQPSPSSSSSPAYTSTSSWSSSVTQLAIKHPIKHDAVRLPVASKNDTDGSSEDEPPRPATLVVSMKSEHNSGEGIPSTPSSDVTTEEEWSSHTSSGATTFDVPFPIYTTQRLCIGALFPHDSIHSWGKKRTNSNSSSSSSPLDVPANFYVRADTTRTTFSEEQLNITVNAKMAFQLTICIGPIAGAPEGSRSLQRVTFGLEEEAVQPPPDGFNTTDRIAIVFLPGWKPDEATETAVAVASSVNGATSLVGAGPTAVAVTNRQQLITKIVLCPQPMTGEQLGSDQSPLNLKIGSGFLRYEAGAMYGNLILFAALAAAFAVLTTVVGSRVNPQKFAGRVLPLAGSNNDDEPTAWQRGQATLRFPGRLAPVAIFLYQATLSSSLRVVLYTEATGGDKLHQYVAIAISTLLMSAFVLLPVFTSFVPRFNASIRYVPQHSTVVHSIVHYLTAVPGEWASLANAGVGVPPREDGVPNKKENHRRKRNQKGKRSNNNNKQPTIVPHAATKPLDHAVERFGTAFEDYRPECVSIIYFDFMLAMLSACATAFNPINRNQCTLLSLFVVGVFFFAALVAVVVRPFDSRLNNAFYAVIAFAQFVSAVAINAVNNSSSNSTEWMSRMETADVVLYYTITLWCLLQVAEGIYGTVQATGVPPGLPNYAHTKDTEAHNLFWQERIVGSSTSDIEFGLGHDFDPTVPICGESEALAAVEEAGADLEDVVMHLLPDDADSDDDDGPVAVRSSSA